MKTILLLIVLSSFSLYSSFSVKGQTTTNVSVLNTSFSPANITIDLGDTVRWTNSSGSHNVNGTSGTFPGNPESFGNSISPNFTFEHKFMTSGTYNYRCDLHFSMGMTGTITVLPSSNIEQEESVSETIVIYPNPIKDKLNIENNTNYNYTHLSLYSVTGEKILTCDFSNSIEINNVESGIYYLRLFGETTFDTKKVVIE